MARLSSRAAGRKRSLRGRTLGMEPLELRSLLSAVSLLEPAVASSVAPAASGSSPAGFSPAQIRHAYRVDQIGYSGGTVRGDGSGQTIAIVDAFGDPKIASDLATFDRTFALPDPPSFRTVDQSGGSQLPTADSGWSMETALDVEWAHAIAPGANLLLVEASSNSLADLLTAVDWARHEPGVSVVSMSWGSGELPEEASLDSFFTTPAGHAGVTFVASSGDDGAGSSWPAVSPNVLAVGGTSLLTRDSRGTYGSERGWGGSGGGLSWFEGEPGYQLGVQGTGSRSIPDVAWNADPRTGFAVYDTVSDNGRTGWFDIGGTSAGAPAWAGLIAIANQGRALAGSDTLRTPADIYRLRSSDFHDVTSGNNGGFRAGRGYDLVTGRGSPYSDLLVRDLSGMAVSVPRVTRGVSRLGPALPASQHSSLAIASSAIAAVALPALDRGPPISLPEGPATAVAFRGGFFSPVDTFSPGDALPQVSAWGPAEVLRADAPSSRLAGKPAGSPAGEGLSQGDAFVYARPNQAAIGEPREVHPLSEDHASPIFTDPREANVSKPAAEQQTTDRAIPAPLSAAAVDRCLGEEDSDAETVGSQSDPRARVVAAAAVPSATMPRADALAAVLLMFCRPRETDRDPSSSSGSSRGLPRVHGGAPRS